jgi:hypothetical protein
MIAIFYDIVLFSIDFSHKFSFIKKKKIFLPKTKFSTRTTFNVNFFSKQHEKSKSIIWKAILFQGNLMENKEKTFRFYRFSQKRTFCLFLLQFSQIKNFFSANFPFV